MSADNGIVLMPEFGGWMVEAVPSKPYASIVDAATLLSCEQKLHERRQILDEFFRTYDLNITSLTNASYLGTPNYIELENP